MIIVSGHLSVDPGERDTYLAGCRAVIEQARAAPGCLAFHLSADPLEADRINVYEEWRSLGDAESFRGSGPSDDQQGAIRDAAVNQHEVSSSQRL